MCEAPTLWFGDGTQPTWPCRNYRVYFEKIFHATPLNNNNHNYESYSVLEKGVAMMEGMFRNMKCISLHTLIIPDVLHTIYHRMLKYLMEGMVMFLEFNK
jgi:hypothetical protein